MVRRRAPRGTAHRGCLGACAVSPGERARSGGVRARGKARWGATRAKSFPILAGAHKYKPSNIHYTVVAVDVVAVVKTPASAAWRLLKSSRV